MSVIEDAQRLTHQQVVARAGQHLSVLAERLRAIEIALAAGATTGQPICSSKGRTLQGIDSLHQELRALSAILCELGMPAPDGTDAQLIALIDRPRLAGLAAVLKGQVLPAEEETITIF